MYLHEYWNNVSISSEVLLLIIQTGFTILQGQGLHVFFFNEDDF